VATRDVLDRARERPFAFAAAVVDMLVIEVAAQSFGVRMLSVWLRSRHAAPGAIALANGAR
jgi:hypothetical protein